MSSLVAPEGGFGRPGIHLPKPYDLVALDAVMRSAGELAVAHRVIKGHCAVEGKRPVVGTKRCDHFGTATTGA